jgi:hypothetical protein
MGFSVPREKGYETWAFTLGNVSSQGLMQELQAFL